MQTTLLGLNKINTTTVQVNEPILGSSLIEFLFTSTNHSKSDWDVQFLYHYFETSKNYFIASFKSKEKHAILVPQILKLYYKNAQASSYDLFITSGFFALYSFEKLVCFKAVQKSVTEEEIIRYLEHTYCIKIEHTVVLSDEELMAFKNEYLNSATTFVHEREYSRFKSNKATITYAIYLMFLVVSTWVIWNSTHTISSKTVATVKKVVVPTKALQTQSIVALMQAINHYKLQLQLFEMNSAHANIKLAHNNKDHLMQFLEDQQLKIKSLNYQKESQIYELTAMVVFD